MTAALASPLPRTPGSGRRKSSGTSPARASSPATGPSPSTPRRSGGWNLPPPKSPHPTSPGTDASTEGRKRRGGCPAPQPSPAFHRRLCKSEAFPLGVERCSEEEPCLRTGSWGRGERTPCLPPRPQPARACSETATDQSSATAPRLTRDLQLPPALPLHAAWPPCPTTGFRQPRVSCVSSRGCASPAARGRRGCCLPSQPPPNPRRPGAGTGR